MEIRARHRIGRMNPSLVPISVVVLAACLFYTLAFVFFSQPDSGFTMTSEWVVTLISGCRAYPDWCESNAAGLQALRVGDRVVSIGDLTHDQYATDRRLVPFAGLGPGDSVPITVDRDDGRQTVLWLIPVSTFASRASGFTGLAFYMPFWLAGTAVLLFLRPRDGR